MARLEEATGARAVIGDGPLESQLGRLKQGELDLVMSDFTEDSPWAKSVSVIEPLQRRRDGRRDLTLAPVARNGENRWIALLEREVRDSTGPGGA